MSIRAIGHRANNEAKPFVLYGSHLPYYSRKVRCYLRWKQIPFIDTPVDLATRSADPALAPGRASGRDCDSRTSCMSFAVRDRGLE